MTIRGRNGLKFILLSISLAPVYVLQCLLFKFSGFTLPSRTKDFGSHQNISFSHIWINTVFLLLICTVSADLLLVEMMGTWLVVSWEIHHVNILPTLWIRALGAESSFGHVTSLSAMKVWGCAALNCHLVYGRFSDLLAHVNDFITIKDLRTCPSYQQKSLKHHSICTRVEKYFKNQHFNGKKLKIINGGKEKPMIKAPAAGCHWSRAIPEKN